MAWANTNVEQKLLLLLCLQSRARSSEYRDRILYWLHVTRAILSQLAVDHCLRGKENVEERDINAEKPKRFAIIVVGMKNKWKRDCILVHRK